MGLVSGLDIIRAIQSIHSPLLDLVFSLLTNLHHEMVYLLVLPLVYWLYDKRFGRFLFSVFVVGLWSNDVLKALFVTPRPDPMEVRVLMAETTGGTTAFPSGHAQTPLIFWGAVAHHLRRPWFTWAAGILVFLIGLSRLYLGLHWPLDVMGGWFIGGVVLGLLLLTRPFWTGEGQSLGLRLVLAVLLPAAAVSLSLLAAPEGEHRQLWLMSGAYAGLLAGSALEEAYVGFDPRAGSTGLQFVKLVLGLVLVLAVKEGFKLVLPDTGPGDMVRYLLVALTATLVMPWLFQRILRLQVSSGPTR